MLDLSEERRLNTYPDREGIETTAIKLGKRLPRLNTYPDREGIETGLFR